MGHWAKAPLDRKQTMMFMPTLDEMIPEDHPVRLFDEILSECDWSRWEQHYVLSVGQPPIHPRILAGVNLYGLSLGIRSSRVLERMCKNSLDFIWLTEGRIPDHSTICIFRNQFERELKDLFRQLGGLAMAMGMVRLNQVALDGTRVKANSSRHATASAKTLEERLAELDKKIEEMFAQAKQADKQDNDLFGESISPNQLPKELAKLRRRQEQLAKALAKARQKEAERKTGSNESKETDKEKDNRKSKKNRCKSPKVPVADPDSSIQPNKEGGYAPNYTPLAAVDGEAGFIVDADVLADSDEGKATVPTVDRVEEGFGEKPKEMLADTAHGSGANLAALDERGVKAYIPLEQREDRDDNPARRIDPREPVAESDWPKLPRNTRTKKLDRCAFLYDSSSDSYYCPMGHVMNFYREQDKQRANGGGIYRLYRCEACVGCALATECIAGKKAKYRTIFRDEYEPLREAMDVRMRSPDGKEVYARRSWIAETPFAFLKGWMGFRQFLVRGAAKVKTEWLWACTAYNLGKLVRAIGAVRLAVSAQLE